MKSKFLQIVSSLWFSLPTITASIAGAFAVGPMLGSVVVVAWTVGLLILDHRRYKRDRIRHYADPMSTGFHYESAPCPWRCGYTFIDLWNWDWRPHSGGGTMLLMCPRCDRAVDLHRGHSHPYVYMAVRGGSRRRYILP